MPPATVGPGPLIEAPFAGTPLTVANSRFVSYSQSTLPSRVEKARNVPSMEPANTAPGITVTAADSARLQPRLGGPQRGSGNCADHTRFPVAKLTACSPPGFGCNTSETGKYALSVSAAEPHCMPPSMPP